MVEGGSVQPLQATAGSYRFALAFAAIVAVASAWWAGPAQARPACATAIIEEWANGTLASPYPLDCYDAAIDALPEDLRAYTTAADDISRAAIAASRSDVPSRQLASTPAAAERARAFPVTVALLAGFVVLLAASGLGASLVRRRRSE
jgi:hypothetical protein